MYSEEGRRMSGGPGALGLWMLWQPQTTVLLLPAQTVPLGAARPEEFSGQKLHLWPLYMHISNLFKDPFLLC